ncbi:tRNA (adenosine(37)-N6)-dimethylallyltransferase MiaA [Patescibacteria group bacterium]
MGKSQDKLIVILGPTASGKSDVAIKLAQKFDGEIISVDSRQIYRGMDIGSGKITEEEQNMAKHYMLDIVEPTEEYSAGKFKREAEKIIEDILSRKKLPILCGGTGFWIKSIVENITFPKVKPNPDLRKKLEKEETEELFEKLKKLDPKRASSIDANNRPRLIRAIEIAKELGSVPEIKSDPKYDSLQIGISREKEILHERIKLNIQKRFNLGMIEEVEKMHKNGIPWKRIESFGLSYSLIPQYLRGEIESKKELIERIYLAEKNYAKRQMTWFQRDKRIRWLKDFKQIEKETREFLEK